MGYGIFPNYRLLHCKAPYICTPYTPPSQKRVPNPAVALKMKFSVLNRCLQSIGPCSFLTYFLHFPSEQNINLSTTGGVAVRKPKPFMITTLNQSVMSQTESLIFVTLSSHIWISELTQRFYWDRKYIKNNTSTFTFNCLLIFSTPKKQYGINQHFLP